ncbi:beta-hydroxyacyl-dehydratase FabZ [Chloropicon primus]|uniref:3-hydroxyacyl-[acyl-carrier-protein] dehydratase n=1 Tax=Chloropicon primus TaxID=1764295 RepID=A0A5B8MBN4_9CHLO|nr:beta-hydroxyacyl-dehydratase FabZ [Chloropicon primus]UPQ96980.1 beta-hydroxyacyl-dehydratase FabZ [Chloropicon primus]|eukprot:QDZ17763.1 beta-hydroxyacyl-dehydratase FabZ [Chloropicon primus]
MSTLATKAACRLRGKPRRGDRQQAISVLGGRSGSPHLVGDWSNAVRVRSSATEADAEAGTPAIEKSSTAFEPVMDIDAIMKILPHRYPFLLVDRVVQYEQGKQAVGMKNVTINDNFFTGHFPTRPIMPGVLIVEALAQVGGIAMMDPDDPKENFFFGGIDGCKFRKPVVPGDTLMLKVALKKMNKRFGVAKMEAKAFVGEDLVCEAELTLYMGN